ncbi:hypothetical protein Cni_G21345 [Canna indica]|uniref:DUF3741 domain-containing protein n=1 Tax=Canna indica TaxID=4628 RepID=A0AAQ3KSY0_9LILI|nr:hypothetical protein Cni_G21345 [Canna indica]
MGNVETMRTSSSRRELGSENRPKTIGCMSGIFHFLSRQHKTSRKRLTSGKRKEKPVVPPPTRPTPPLVIEDAGAKKPEARRLSCETSPRSPTIPQEIRRRKRPPAAVVAAASPDSSRRPPALLARLMGLEDGPAAPLMTASSDKQRELLHALEKCDEDLKALRQIIEAVRSAEVNSKAVVSAAGMAGRLLETDAEDSKSDCNGEQPSPVSVLDAISSPRYRSKRRSRNDNQETTAAGSRIVKPSRTAVVFIEEDYNKARNATEKMPKGAGRHPVVEDFRWPARRAESVGRRYWWRRRRGVSRAMTETVEEVWEEGAWEAKWELGRVGMWVEANILWDLVEELVVELLVWYCCKLSPPLRTCRKRLRF